MAATTALRTTAVAEESAQPLDYRLLFIALTLVMIGNVIVFSATFPIDGRPSTDGTLGDAYATLREQAFFSAVGVALMLLVAFVLSPEFLRKCSFWLLVICVVLVGLTYTRFGVEMGNARRWLRIGPLLFQPSEPLKLALILYLARLLSRCQGKPWAFARAFALAVAFSGVIAFLILKQPDLGTSMLVFGACLAMLFLAGANRPLVALLGGGAVAGATCYSYFTGYGWDRFIGWLHPEEHATGAGYHPLKMLVALARGGLTGAGPGQSMDKWLNFPARHTDSVLCILAGDYGLLGCALLLIFLFCLGQRGLHIASRAPDRWSALAAAGLTALLVMQAALNIAVCTALVPCTGLTLPFISNGGSSLLCALLAVGVLLSISRHSAPPDGS